MCLHLQGGGQRSMSSVCLHWCSLPYFLQDISQSTFSSRVLVATAPVPHMWCPARPFSAAGSETQPLSLVWQAPYPWTSAQPTCFWGFGSISFLDIDFPLGTFLQGEDKMYMKHEEWHGTRNLRTVWPMIFRERNEQDRLDSWVTQHSYFSSMDRSFLYYPRNRWHSVIKSGAGEMLSG